jgi:hypothetical protein
VAAEIGVSWRRIVVLLVAVLALGGYLYFYEVPQAKREAQKEKLLGVDKDAISGIDLVYADREIALAKGDKGWRLTKPVDAAADDAAVTSLLGSLAGAEVQKTIDELPADLGPFGLDKPTVTVRLALKSGEVPPIAVGKNTAIGGKTYVRKDDEKKLYLTTSSLGFALNKQAKDLRDKQLLAFQDDDVSRVTIAAADGKTTTLARKDKDSWTVDPGDYPADLTEVRSYLSSLRATRAVDFPDEAPTDLAKYGLDKPTRTVTVYTGKEGKASQALLLGKETTEGTQKQIYAKTASAPTVYALGDWTVQSLRKDVAALRDKTVLGFDPSRVGTVALARRDGVAVTMTRGGGETWRVESAEKPKDTAIARFLDDVHDLRGADIAAEPPGDLARFGLDTPDLRITLSDREGKALGSVLLAKHDSKYYAMREGGPTVFEVRDYMFTRLDKRLADFAETTTTTTATTASTTTTAAPAR